MIDNTSEDRFHKTGGLAVLRPHMGTMLKQPVTRQNARKSAKHLTHSNLRPILLGALS